MSRTLDTVALFLVIMGGLNWGLVGLFGFDLVAAIFGAIPLIGSLLAKIVYVFIGLSGIYMIYYALSRR